MWGRLTSIVLKEFIQIRRDPRTLAMAVALPVVQLLIFAYAINTTVDHIPAVVLDGSRDATSRDFVRAFFNTGYFDPAGEADSPEGIRRAIDAGQAKVGFIVPPDFSANLRGGRPTTAQVVVDGSDPNIAQTALFAAGAIAQARSVELIPAAGGRRATPARGAPAFELRPIVLYNPAMASVVFMVPGLIGLILQFQTLILTAFAIVRERERGTLEQLIVTPIRPWELMLGKIIPYVVIAFAGAGMALGVGRFWFGVEIAGSLLLLLLLSIVFLLSSLGIGLFISTISRTQTQAMQTALFVMLPSILLSGFMFARDAMPPIIYALGYLIPLTYFLQILRGIMLKGVGLDVLWPQALPLALFGLAVFTISSLRFTKRLD